VFAIYKRSRKRLFGMGCQAQNADGPVARRGFATP